MIGALARALSPPVPSAPPSRRFAWVLTGAYALVLAFALFHHELWRDELQAWMLARDSAGPLDLLRNMDYEATSVLWHLLLLPVTRLTTSPAGMQILHWIVASATVYVLARNAPFAPLHKGLLVFGYLPLFEYGVVSRSYALGLLGVVAACALLPQRRTRPWGLALVLVLTAHTSPYACIVALALWFTLVVELAVSRGARTAAPGRPLRGPPVALAFAAAGILLSLLQTLPPPDVTLSTLDGTWRHARFLELHPSGANVAKLVPMVVFLPVDPRFVPVVGLAPESPALLYGPATAAVLVVLACAFHRRSPLAVMLFLGLVAALMAFFHLVHYGSIRHHGFLLVAFLVLCWAAPSLAPAPVPPAAVRGIASRLGAFLLTVLLSVQAVGGLRAVAMEVQRPFSLAGRTAAYIRSEGLEALPLLGYPDWSASAVVGHLSPSKRIHYVQGRREGSFVVYDGARIGPGPQGTVPLPHVLHQAKVLAAEGGGRALLVLAFDPDLPARERHVRHLASFTGAVVEDESFHLFLVEPSREAPPGPHPRP